MTKIKYDVSDVEAGPDFDTPVAVGVYKCKINDVQEGSSKSSGNPMLTVEYEIIQKGDWKGRRLWDYIVLNEASAWKLRQFIDALGKKGKGTLDTNAVLGEKVLVRVKHETDDRDPDNIVVRARVGSVSQVPEAVDEEEEDEDVEDEDIDDEDVDDDDEVDEDEDEDDEDDEDEDDEDEDLDVPESYEELEELDRDDLEALIEQEELEVTHNKRTKDDVLLERVAEALELEPEDEDEDDDDDEEEVDYDEWTIADLTNELKSRGLNTKTKQKGAKKKALFIKRLEKDDEDGDEPF